VIDFLLQRLFVWGTSTEELKASPIKHSFHVCVKINKLPEQNKKIHDEARQLIFLYSTISVLEILATTKRLISCKIPLINALFERKEGKERKFRALFHFFKQSDLRAHFLLIFWFFCCCC
jgi:hypothetical protein